MRSIVLWALCVPAGALAQDYAAEAERRMSLSFDLDELAERVDAPRPAAMAYDSRGVVPAQPQAALPLEPNSTLDQVTVYQHQAMVRRHRTVPLPAGDDVVVFEGLPLGIDAGGLQAAVVGTRARIVSVELQSGVGDVEETERIEAVRAELKTLVAELGDVRDGIESLLAQRAYLRRAVLGSDGSPRDALPEVKSTLSYVGDTERELARDLRSLTERAQELGDEVTPLLVKLDDPLATGVRVVVGAHADAPVEVTVELDYQVQGAGWSPAYNARLDPSTDDVSLEYFGVITQRTGEDWTDARLFLSTARPAQAGALPELTPWFLGRSGWGTLDAGGGYYDRGPTAYGGVAAMSTTDEGNGTVVMEIPGKRTVLGDGSPQRVPVGTRSMKATLELVAVPKLAIDVYRRATLQYDGDLPLLPGPVASHVGGDYVGTGVIATVIPGEDLHVSFGTDDRFRVTRRLVSRQEEHLGGKRGGRYTLTFQIAVTNLTGRPQTVEVRDQLPISEREDVLVKTIAVSEGHVEDATTAPGVLVWPLALAAGETRTLDLAFSVSGPTEAAAVFMREMEMMH